MAFPNAHSSLPWTLGDFSAEVEITHAFDGGAWLRAANAGNDAGAEGVLLVTKNGSLYWHNVQGNGYGSIINKVDYVYDYLAPLRLRVTVRRS